MYKTIPCQEFLRARIDYDPETGLSTWKVRVSNVQPGQRAASKSKNSMKISFDRKVYIYARVIYVYMTGEQIPVGMYIDHINGDWTDNRWCNLRLASPAGNSANVGSRKNKVLPKGVTYYKKKGIVKGYIAHAKGKYLGLFRTIEDARNSYEHASLDLFGEFACINR